MRLRAPLFSVSAMPKIRRSKSNLILLAGIAAVVVVLEAGCQPPEGGGQGQSADQTPVTVPEGQPPETASAEPPSNPQAAITETSVEPDGPIAEPGAFPDAPTARPMVDPGRLAAEPRPESAQPGQPADEPAASAADPGANTDGDPDTMPNPLRGGVRPVGGSPDTTDPKVPPSGITASEVPADEPAEEKEDHQPFDPVKENGPIFVGWPEKVKLALVITGRLEGHIEPCGCAGVDRMKGGISRRHSLLKQLGKKGWPVVGIDVGGLAKGYGRQAELKFHTLSRAMEKMGYQAIALGRTDLRLQAGELAADVLDDETNPSPFLSANVAVFDWSMTAKSRVVEVAGVKLGITAVLGRQFLKEVRSEEILTADPEAALAKVVPELKNGADYLILLAHATMNESLELARKFPDFDLVVTSAGPPEPPAKPSVVPNGKARLIQVGEKGMHAIVWAIDNDPKQPPRDQRVPLDSRFPASEQMKLLMELYQEELQRSFDKLGFPIGEQAPPHPQRELNGPFVGSKRCKSCHEVSYTVWKKSGHAKAYDTLAKLDPPRPFDPECMSCHVVGWHPGEHFPYQSGFQSLEEVRRDDGTIRLKATPELAGVGCESCHGPGRAHSDAEEGGDLALQQKLHEAVRVTKAESEKRLCGECHDLDNSPDFEFETYWPKVEHYEEEEVVDSGQSSVGSE